MKLHFTRLARRAHLPLSLQCRNCIDARGMRPRFSDAPRLPQGNDIRRRLLDDTEAIQFQLPEDCGFP